MVLRGLSICERQPWEGWGEGGKGTPRERETGGSVCLDMSRKDTERETSLEASPYRNLTSCQRIVGGSMRLVVGVPHELLQGSRTEAPAW